MSINGLNDQDPGYLLRNLYTKLKDYEHNISSLMFIDNIEVGKLISMLKVMNLQGVSKLMCIF